MEFNNISSENFLFTVFRVEVFYSGLDIACNERYGTTEELHLFPWLMALKVSLFILFFLCLSPSVCCVLQVASQRYGIKCCLSLSKSLIFMTSRHDSWKTAGISYSKGKKILSEYWESFSANNLTWKFWKKIQKKIEFCGI